MKKIFIAIGGVLFVLFAVVAINTAQFESKQLPVDAIAPHEVDLDAVSARLASAIQHPTVSNYDPSLVPTATFDSLHVFLEQSFPRVHAELQQESVNTYSLLYTWQGTDEALDPLVLMAHMDVVPVEPGTEGDWQQSPFEGFVDDEYIWGRGTLDNKNGVMGILEAVEMLIGEGFQTKRTVILAFGHDEEVGGRQGAKLIAKQFEEKRIEPWLLIDEGGIVLEAHSTPVEAPLALIGIAEKGYLSLALTVNAEGGHSSMPNQETAVGILSTALYRLINDPFPARLEGVTGTLFEYLGPEMSLLYRMLFANKWLVGPLLVNQLSADPSSAAVLRTTIAPTMLKGSPKDNVLPSQAQAVVNFRILPGETIESVTERVRSVVDDDRVLIEPANNSEQNPSPVSSIESEGFMILQQTIHELFPEALVAPYLVVGGTDAKHFSHLSSNVYRFSPVVFREGDLARVHGKNERILKEDYGNSIRFYRQVILNATQ